MNETLRMLEAIYYELGQVKSPDKQPGITEAREIIDFHISNLLEAEKTLWKRRDNNDESAD